MFLIQLENGQPIGNAITLENFKQCHPEISLSFPLLPEHIEPHGYGIYDFSMPPEHGVFEKLEEVAPVKSPENGAYYQTWFITVMTAEEQAERTEQEWKIIRGQRNSELINCDWTQLPDVNITVSCLTAFQAYRQDLRNITLQSDPFNIIWPEAPTEEWVA